MKRSFIASLLCILIMGLTACVGGGDETSDMPVKVEPIPIETKDGEHSSTSNETEEETENSDDNEPKQPDQSNKKEELERSEQSSEETESEYSEQSVGEDELEQKLSEYREERENMTNVAMGNGVSGYGAPNAENYGFQTDTANYMQNFDSRELNKAYETAKKYVTDILTITVETNAVVYACADPRITEIYEAEDKGVADGYDAGNIFVCEYCDNGTWQYLILVRDGKGSDWSVIHHGSSYKE